MNPEMNLDMSRIKKDLPYDKELPVDNIIIHKEFPEYKIKIILASEKLFQHKVKRISALMHKDFEIPILKTLKDFHKFPKKHDYSKSTFIKWVDSTNFNLFHFEKWKNGVNFKTGCKITIGKQILLRFK